MINKLKGENNGKQGNLIGLERLDSLIDGKKCG